MAAAYLGGPRVDLHTARKQWATLRACFAIAGFEVDRLTAGRGYRVSRWKWSVDVPDLTALFVFAERAGIDLPREAPP